MAGSRRDVLPTRSAALDLKAEQRFAREGYAFLDEKRMLLAGEILKRLDRYQEVRARFLELQRKASSALADAVARHGIEGVSVYPPADLETALLTSEKENFLGVQLVRSEMSSPGGEEMWPPENPSRTARHGSESYRDLITAAAHLAGLECSLRRLRDEYRRTDRRARALENILLPEIDCALKDIEDHLEMLDQEEAVHVRCARKPLFGLGKN